MERKFNLILIDFSWVYNRYYYIASKKEAKNIKEELYEMLLGFLNTVATIHWDINILLALDSPTKQTKGYALNKEYKQNRNKEAKKEVYSCLKDILAGLVEELPKNCSFLWARGREADEIIAYQVKTFSKRYKSYNILIYSGDKDLLQLTAYPNTYASDKFNNGKFVIKSNEEIFGKFRNSKGEDFTRISEDKRDILKYRVLRGDISDNLPPVFPRIKDKEIIDIIKNYWTDFDILTDKKVSDIIENIKEANEGLASKLEAGKSTWITNYEIMDLYEVKVPSIKRLGDVEK